MRWIFILCIAVTLNFALPQIEFKNSCVPLAQFSESQKEVLLRSYLAGEHEGFGLTLAAIAWKESCAGEYKMNFQDPSAGNFHAYIPGVINRYPKLKQNGFTQNMVGAMLVENDNFAEQIAITELKYWQKEHNGNWKNIIKSYNKGYSWQKNEQANIQAEKYYQEVAMRVKQLESYFQSKETQAMMFQISQNNFKSTKPRDLMKSQETMKNITQDSTKMPQVESQRYYAYGEESIDYSSSILPIYQRGNEFAAPLKSKKTIIKEFDLLETY
ncbi:hypothetical protein [uncultured Helicobacter sp.]|uniref:hypothetical protein n=1 Tax=uncultured Helicobacter sp. TaxID=175537 RepID=UPI002633D39C|nr:hypothetical protein [uncultured Helicobacter sp.]